MALVKKLQKGNTITPVQNVEDFLDEKLENTKFTKRALPYAQKAAQKFRDLYKEFYNTPKFDEIYQYDKLANKYTIKKDQLPENLQEYNWEGTDNPINKNLLGQYSTGKNEEEKFNSLIASWLLEYEEKNPRSTQVTNKQKRSIASLQDFIRLRDFGGKGDVFESRWEEMGEEERKKRTLDAAKRAAQDYLTEFSENKDKYDYEKVEETQNLLNIIDNGDWELFVDSANKLGWDPTNLSYKDIVEEEPSDSEENQLKRKAEFLREKGLDDQTIGALLASGYDNIVEDYNPAGEEWFSNFLKEKNWLVVQDKMGNTKILDKGMPISSHIFGNPRFKGYGHYITSDDLGNVKYFSPTTEGWNREYFMNPVGSSFGYRGLEVRLPEDYVGWTAKGWQSKDEKGNIVLDKYDFADFTKKITLEHPTTQEIIELNWSPNGYIRQDTEEPFQIDVSGYTQDYKEMPISNMLTEESDPYLNIKGSPQFNNWEDLEAEISLILDPNNPIGRNKGIHPDRVAKVISDLRYKIENTSSMIERLAALNYYEKIKNMDLGAATKYIQNSAEELGGVSSRKSPAPIDVTQDFSINAVTTEGFSFKKGGVLDSLQKRGILKAQKGLSMPISEYLEKYGGKKEEKKTKENEEKTPVKDITGTLKDMDALDAGSLAATGVSFIPGIGAIGGLALTGIDIARGIRDDESVGNIVGETLLNLGFTAASLFGFGGLRMLKVASKATKATDKVLDTAKALKNIKKLEKIGGATNDATKLVKGVGSASKKLGKETLEEFGERIAKSNPKKLLPKDIEILKDLGITVRKNGAFVQEIPGTVGKTLKKSSVKDIIKGAKEATLSFQTLQTGAYAQELNAISKAARAALKSKPVKTGLKAGMIGAVGIPALKSSVNIVGDVKEGGFGNIEVGDLQRVMVVSSLGKQTWRNIKDAKAVRRFTKPTDIIEDSFTLKAGKKEFTLEKSLEVPSKIKSIKSPIKGKYKPEQIKEFKKELKASGITEKNDVKEILKRLEQKGDVVVVTNKGTQSGLQMDVTPDKFSGTGASDFIRAKKALSRGLTSSGSTGLWRLNPAKVAKVKNLRSRLNKIDSDLENVAQGTTQFKNLQKQQTSLISELIETQSLKEGGVLKFQTPASPLFKNAHMLDEVVIIRDKKRSTSPVGRLPMQEAIDLVPIPTKEKWNRFKNSLPLINNDISSLLNEDGTLNSLSSTIPSIKPNADLETVKIENLTQRARNRAAFPSGKKPSSMTVKNISLNSIPSEKTLVGINLTSNKETLDTPVNYTGWKGPLSDRKWEGWDKIKDYVKDPSVWGNVANLATSLIYNDKIARKQRRAAVEGIVRPDFMKRRFYRVSSDVDAPYTLSASNYISKSGRLAESSSDIESANAIQLEGEKLASQARLEGAVVKANDLMQKRIQQEQSDASVDQTNLGLMNQYKSNVARARQQLNLVDANKYAANAAAIQGFTKTLAHNIEKIKGQQLSKDYYNIINDPKYTDLSTNLSKIMQSKGDYQGKWEDFINSDEGKTARGNQIWEQSKEYEQWKSQVEAAERQLQPYIDKIKAARLNLQVYSPYSMKDGGKLELEKLKQAHRKELLFIKELNRSILENNKLALKSLVKIFD